MKVAYSHLIKFIPCKPSLSDISEKFFQLGHEHEIHNNIFDMELTPNRGDCLSINGLLRDLKVFYKIDLNHPTYENQIDSLKIDFVNNVKDSCSNIAFLKIDIEGDIKPYRGMFKNYFNDLGVNKNNFFTDISNYISYETGQPTHCYDAKKISDKFSLETISDDIEFETLLDKKINLCGNNLVFMRGGDIINLAGVIGGKNTACSKNTKSVIIECAYFDPKSVIGKSVKYDIKSDAAYKFERGVDPLCHEKVLRRFIYIVEKHSKIKNLQIFKRNYNDLMPCEILTSPENINKILGTSIEDNLYEDILIKLGFRLKDNKIVVPSHRSDVNTENDVAEEIARVIGYDNIPLESFNIPEIKDIHTIKNFDEFQFYLKDLLYENGFNEVINYPFVSDVSNNSIKVDNPIDSNKSFIRTSLQKSLVENLLYNEKRQKDSIKLFEISDTYFSQNNSIKNNKLVGIICSGRVGKNYKDFSKNIDVTYLKEILEKFSEEITFDIKQIPRDDLDSKIKNPIAYVEFEINGLLKYNSKNNKAQKKLIKFNKYNPISEYPLSQRDLSFSIKKKSSYDEIQKLVLNYGNEIIKEIFIFDFFHNEKSHEVKIGFRIVFQSVTQTITDDQINEVMDCIINDALKIDSVNIPGLVRWPALSTIYLYNNLPY